MKSGENRRGVYVPARGIPFTLTPMNACERAGPSHVVLSPPPHLLVLCVQTVPVWLWPWETALVMLGAPGQGRLVLGMRLSPVERKSFAMRHLAVESRLLEAGGRLGFEGVVYGPL